MNDVVWSPSEIAVDKCLQEMERDISTLAVNQALGTITAAEAHGAREFIYKYQKILKGF